MLVTNYFFVGKTYYFCLLRITFAKDISHRRKKLFIQVILEPSSIRTPSSVILQNTQLNSATSSSSQKKKLITIPYLVFQPKRFYTPKEGDFLVSLYEETNELWEFVTSLAVPKYHYELYGSDDVFTFLFPWSMLFRNFQSRILCFQGQKIMQILILLE